jgi:hypothetical protein
VRFRLIDVDDDSVMGYCGTDPICGEDFCDDCGCCLACYNECPCCPQAVVYSAQLDEWMRSHGFDQNPFS